jgi:hypothetical protein
MSKKIWWRRICICVKKRTKMPLTFFERGEQKEFEQVFAGVFSSDSSTKSSSWSWTR